mmetsp:Transcript_29043/g.76620  ORF Transcript_29043/g.76620 Transcript_29043/m.76620 type:complete len:229 (+) Transcript_29043:5387-6073(+)
MGRGHVHRQACFWNASEGRASGLAFWQGWRAASLHTYRGSIRCWRLCVCHRSTSGAASISNLRCCHPGDWSCLTLSLDIENETLPTANGRILCLHLHWYNESRSIWHHSLGVLDNSGNLPARQLQTSGIRRHVDNRKDANVADISALSRRKKPHLGMMPGDTRQVDDKLVLRCPADPQHLLWPEGEALLGHIIALTQGHREGESLLSSHGDWHWFRSVAHGTPWHKLT